MKKQIRKFLLVLMLLLSFAILLNACGNTKDPTKQDIVENPNTSGTADPSDGPGINPPPSDDPTNSGNNGHVHSYGAWQTVQASTCTEAGSQKRVCSCGDTQTEALPIASHTAVTDPAVAAGCTTEGKTEGSHCSVCQAVLQAQSVIPTTGHTPVTDPGTPAGCTTTGLSDGSHCSVCQTVLQAQSAIPAKGHTAVTDPAVAASCTTEGKTEGSHCSVCQAVLQAQTAIPAKGHTAVTDPAVAASCTTDGKTEGSHCSVCQAVLQAQTVIPATGHTPVTDPGTPADCTTTGLTDGSHCSVCQAILQPQTIIPVKGHTEVTVAGKAPTETEPGLTDGKKCSVCQVIILAQERIAPYLESCSDDYAYIELGKQSNGSAKQALYDRIDAQAKVFHTDSAKNATDDVAFTVTYQDLGLTFEEAFQVWMCYRNDHPLYYWISSTVSYSDADLMILVDSAYAQSSARTQYNAQLYKKIAAFANAAAGETSAYQIALAYHDAIIKAIDYAYEEDGITPEDELWAHSIVGVFDERGGVCEGYSRAFQLLLNLKGIDNIFVTGIAGSAESGYENHAWNLIRLDDGNWYWCDLTWDDRPGWEWGIVYNYFCVNDTQDTNWMDSYDPVPAVSFLETHTPLTDSDPTLYYQITLPDRASDKYKDANEPIIRDIFTVDGLTYSVVAHRALQLIGVDKDGALVIPENVSYKAGNYIVISIGAIRYDGLFTEGQVVTENITVTIPKTVQFIWDSALAGYYVERYIVDDANPYFTDLDGVLFTKSLYTLIQYPCSAPATDKYVIPDATGRVAHGAFGGLVNPMGELVIGKNVDNFGYANWGSGYTDVPITEGFAGNVIKGNLGYFAQRMAYEGTYKISVHPENYYIKIVDGVVYGCTDGIPVLALCGESSEITTAILLDGVLEIDPCAFAGCKALTQLSLPDSLCRIEYGLCDAPNLTAITFRGTVEQWSSINKLDGWDRFDPSLPPLTVICTNGTVS